MVALSRYSSICCILILFFGLQSFAGTILPKELVAKRDVILRDSPPSQRFLSINKPGKHIDKILKGERLEVEETREIRTPLRTDLWILVKRLDHPIDGESVGWAYYGTINNSINFENIK